MKIHTLQSSLSDAVESLAFNSSIFIKIIYLFSIGCGQSEVEDFEFLEVADHVLQAKGDLQEFYLQLERKQILHSHPQTLMKPSICEGITAVKNIKA